MNRAALILKYVLLISKRYSDNTLSEQILSFFLCEQSNNANNILKKKHVKIKSLIQKEIKLFTYKPRTRSFP